MNANEEMDFWPMTNQERWRSMWPSFWRYFGVRGAGPGYRPHGIVKRELTKAADAGALAGARVLARLQLYHGDRNQIVPRRMWPHHGTRTGWKAQPRMRGNGGAGNGIMPPNVYPGISADANGVRVTASRANVQDLARSWTGPQKYERHAVAIMDLPSMDASPSLINGI